MSYLRSPVKIPERSHTTKRSPVAVSWWIMVLPTDFKRRRVHIPCPRSRKRSQNITRTLPTIGGIPGSYIRSCGALYPQLLVSITDALRVESESTPAVKMEIW